jgi:anti-sigma regulatory factor (Ser/Thr protein kinase)
MDVRARTTLPASVAAPARARAFARQAVAGRLRAVPLEDVTLVVSELVTNAVLHGLGDVTLAVSMNDDDAVHVEVGDDQPDLADATMQAPDAESGRGLLLVSRLADRWGVRPERGGKVVWADVAG